MEKAVKLHTCSLHIQRDEKSKLKEHEFGFLEKRVTWLNFLSPVTENKSTYVVNMGWERIYSNFKNLKINNDLLIKHCEINFQTCEKSLLVSHLVYYTYA